MSDKTYSIKEVARFFEKTPAWVYWCLNNDRFTYENGEMIPPVMSSNGRSRRYDLDAIQEMSLSLYRHGQLSEEALSSVTGKILTERTQS